MSLEAVAAIKQRLPLDISASHRIARLLFMLAVVWGASIVWMAPHPPMVDLPQHAGQIALLRELLLGTSPWSYMFRINPMTPYLIGYGLALPLSMFMPIVTALKVLISLAYLAFIYMCVLLRRHYNGDERLDWLFLVPFFGFAFKWGFFTFLIAAPIGLYFIYLADLYAKQPTVKLAFWVFAIGVLLLMSHGLVFLFGMATGLALFCLGRKFRTLEWRLLLPYGGLLLICGLYYLVNKQVNAGMHVQLMGIFSWNVGPSRLAKALIYSVAPTSLDGYILPKVAGLILLFAVPWMLGLRIDWQNKSRWIPFAMLLLVMMIGPDLAWNTAFLYQRFAIFLLPAYAWMFTSREPAAGPATSNSSPKFMIDKLAVLRPMALPVAILACALILGINTVTFLKFKKETSDFDELMFKIEPGQRAVGIALDQKSLSDGNEKIFAHYALWYQAENRGLVDFNFAWFPPQIVRFRPEYLPGIKPGFDWHTERFNWKRNRGDDYNYLFVRHLAAIPKTLFAGAICPPIEVMTEGNWTVFKPGQC